MKDLVKHRFWALLFVMLLTGFVLLACLIPVYVAFYKLSLGNPETFWDAWKITYTAVLAYDLSVGDAFPFLAICFVLGAIVQGIGVLFWSLVREYKYFRGSKFLFFFVRVTEKCTKSASLRAVFAETEGKYPLPGGTGYAELQFYLAENEALGAYVEWERFLHYAYEYLAFSFASVMTHTAVFVVLRFSQYVSFKSVTGFTAGLDGTAICALLLFLFLTILFVSAGQLHRAAHRQALVLAWQRVDSGTGESEP